MRKWLRSVLLTAALLLTIVAVAPSVGAQVTSAPQPTEIPGVTAQLAFLRQYQGVLHLGILFHNDQDQLSPTKAIEYAKVSLIDAKDRKKYFPLKGADGQFLAGPFSDASNGGRW